MNTIKFASFISYLTSINSGSLIEYEIEVIADRIKDMLEPSASMEVATAEPIRVDLVPLFDCIHKGLKIDAIREHRRLTGFGLKESKDEIERIMK